VTAAAVAGAGCVLRRGDGNSGTIAVRASRTMGTSNSQLRILWATGGTAGNSKTCSVVVSGNNTPLSVAVTTSAVTINSATNGSGVATSTVAEIITVLYANSVFRANWDADEGAGNGTGVIAAATSASLTGGVDGETFTMIAEVKSVRGPSLSAGTIDVTTFESNRQREFISSLRDGGQVSFAVNYLPNALGTGHQAIINDQRDGNRRNFELRFDDTRTTTLAFSGVVTGCEITAELEQAVQANITVKVSGWVTYY
jgi:hypothetical protein